MKTLREWGWETTVFRAATAVALLHAVDDAFLNRQAGVELGQHVLAAFVALAAGLGAAWGFPRLRPGLRAGISLVFGVFAIVNGALHVAHVSVDGAAASDYTGVLAVAAGVVLVALGLAIPFRHRGEGATTTSRRWGYRVVAVVGGALLLYAVVAPVSGGIVQTHKHREPIDDPPSAAYEPVTFRATDGLAMSGWYVRSKNRAAVVVVHGGGGDRTGALDHAYLLSRRGYGVLVYDSRGRGESEGSHNALGWGWEKDVAGALAFLRERPDVDPDRIGGLGLSTGADVLIDVATTHRELKAVVSDGATFRSFDDWRNLTGIDASTPFYWTFITAVRVLSGSSPGKPLEDLVAQISPTPLLLIASGNAQRESDVNRLYAEAAREPVDFWDIPDGTHTAAVRERPAEYERRVVGFFDRALVPRQSGS